MHYAIQHYNIRYVSYNSEMKEYVIVCDTELTDETVSMMLGVAVEERGAEDDGTQYFMVAD
ncbi:hypothetical protein N9C48_01735 [bacterium]|jgi:hypothetical protein|nr:hypothetical protein [bacterium]